MIPQRFRRLLGAAVLVLAPSVGLAQSALQQPNLVASPGVTVDALPAAITKLYQNDLFLQTLVAGRFNTLGAAAYLNVGTITGTVADGGALTAEMLRAQAAEQVNATAIQANATAITTETNRAQGVEALKAPIASPTFTGTPRVPTAAQGATGTQAASLDFVATAVAAGAGGNQGVPPSRQILTSGLATGGGDLTADRTVTVAKAAQSDVAAGTDDAKALTSYSVAAALGAKAPLASPALVGTPMAPTAAAGTSTTQIATTAFVGTAVGALPVVAPNSGLAVVSGGNLLFKPFRGNLVLVNGTLRTIPSAGVSLAPTGTSPGSLYFAYLYWTGSALALEASTTGYVTDATTGMALKSGDATRTLVAMFTPTSGPAFSSSLSSGAVRSWFNDPGLTLSAVATQQFNGGGSTTWTTSAGAPALTFLLWAGEAIDADFDSSIFGSSTAVTTYATAFSLDGTAVTDRGAKQTGASNQALQDLSLGAMWSGLAEGAHTLSIVGQNPSTGTGDFLSYKFASGFSVPTLRLRARRALQ